MKKLILLLVFTFSFMFSGINTYANTALGGSISYKYIATNTYLVKATIFRDCSHSASIKNTLSLEMGYFNDCGTIGSFTVYKIPRQNPEISSECINLLTRCTSWSNPNFGVEQFEFEGILNLPHEPDTCQQWKLYMGFGCCRSSRNISGLYGSPVYIDAYLNNAAFNTNHNSVEIGYDYIPQICLNKTQEIKFKTNEIDGDSVVFSWENAKRFNGSHLPSNERYNNGYSPSNPGASSTPFLLNPKTGAIHFTPNIQQEFVICLKASEYRNGQLVGWTTLDMPWRIYNPSCVDSMFTYLNDIIYFPHSTPAMNQLEIEFDEAVFCNTIAADGSDFILLNPQNQVVPITKATKNCNGYKTSYTVDLKLAYQMNKFGTYKLYIKNSSTNSLKSGCNQSINSKDTLKIIYGHPTNTKNLTQNYQLKTFPNPTNGELQIDFIYPEGKNLNINIYNLLGTKVHHEKIETFDGNYQGILNLNHLPDQTYLLELETEKEIIRKKIILLD